MNFSDLSLKAKILLGSSITLILLVIVGVVGLVNLEKLVDTNMWVDHTHKVIRKAKAIEASAVDMETGMRGYLLAGKEGFLDPYKGGWERFGKQVSELKNTVSDNPSQVRLLEEISDNIKTWKKDVIEPSIALRREIGDAKTMNDMAKIVGEARGKKYFDKFRGQIELFVEREKQLMAQRKKKAESATSVGTLRNSLKWVDHTHVVIENAMKIEGAAVDMETGMRGYLLAGKEEFLDPYKGGKTQFNELVGNLQKTVNDNPAQVRLLSEIKETIDEWQRNVTEPTIALRRVIGDAKTMDDMADLVGRARGKKYFDKFRSQIATFTERESALMAKRQKNAESTTQSTYYSITIGIIVATFLSLVASLIVTSSITKPFQNIFKGLKKFSTRELQHLNKEFLGIIDNMTNVAGQVSLASEEISKSSEILSKNVSEQASSVEETSASIEEMSGMVQNNVAEAKSSKEISDRMKDQMGNLKGAMSEILDSNQKIEHLSKIIDEIGDKTKVIDEIVFQTKLLSFNASVEAERAGEHGRGFAVVAQEVGNLAQMSGKAALEISEIVKESTQQANTISAENRARVEQGSIIVEETRSQAELVSKGATQLYSASNEQAKGIEQVNSAIDVINQATQQSSSISEENATSGTELARQAEQLNNHVYELNRFLKGTESESDSSLFNKSSYHNKADNVVSLKAKESNSYSVPMKKAAGAEEVSIVSSGAEDEWSKI